MTHAEFPCADYEGLERAAMAMAGRLLAGAGTVDFGRTPGTEEVQSVGRAASRLAGEEQHEPFASAAAKLQTPDPKILACARNWATLRCRKDCPALRLLS